LELNAQLSNYNVGLLPKQVQLRRKEELENATRAATVKSKAQKRTSKLTTKKVVDSP
jgi:hypothetical protein